MLNRSAVVVRYREAFRDWLRSIGVEEEEFQDRGDKSVSLSDGCDRADTENKRAGGRRHDALRPSYRHPLCGDPA